MEAAPCARCRGGAFRDGRESCALLTRPSRASRAAPSTRIRHRDDGGADPRVVLGPLDRLDASRIGRDDGEVTFGVQSGDGATLGTAVRKRDLHLLTAHDVRVRQDLAVADDDSRSEPSYPDHLWPGAGGDTRDELLDLLHCAHFLSPHWFFQEVTCELQVTIEP